MTPKHPILLEGYYGWVLVRFVYYAFLVIGGFHPSGIFLRAYSFSLSDVTDRRGS